MSTEEPRCPKRRFDRGVSELTRFTIRARISTPACGSSAQRSAHVTPPCRSDTTAGWLRRQRLLQRRTPAGGSGRSGREKPGLGSIGTQMAPPDRTSLDPWSAGRHGGSTDRLRQTTVGETEPRLWRGRRLGRGFRRVRRRARGGGVGVRRCGRRESREHGGLGLGPVPRARMPGPARTRAGESTRAVGSTRAPAPVRPRAGSGTGTAALRRNCTLQTTSSDVTDLQRAEHRRVRLDAPVGLDELRADVDPAARAQRSTKVISRVTARSSGRREPSSRCRLRATLVERKLIGMPFRIFFSIDLRMSLRF